MTVGALLKFCPAEPSGVGEVFGTDPVSVGAGVETGTGLPDVTKGAGEALGETVVLLSDASGVAEGATLLLASGVVDDKTQSGGGFSVS